MARARIEWVPVQTWGLGTFGFDHLQLVFQPGDETERLAQEEWFVIEGTRDVVPGSATPVLGVLGADGTTTLAQANPVETDTGGIALPTAEQLVDEIGTPASRGSAGLPLLDAFGAWQTMAHFAQEIEAQQLPYRATGVVGTGLPTINSSSVIASLLYYVGLDISNHTPLGLRSSPGQQTLIGTTGDDTMQIEFNFTTLVGGLGNDTFQGTDSSNTESFYGGKGDDIFVWSEGDNIFHGGQPELDYDNDGTDTIIYEGVGDVLLTANESAIPHILPDYFAHHSGGLDWLFSVERLQWSDTTDNIVLGPDISLIEDGLIFDLGDDAGGRGDSLDISQLQEDLLINAAVDDAVFIQQASAQDFEHGLWLENAEWLTASSGSDKIYLSSVQRGVEAGAGDDIIDARLVATGAGLSPLGYDTELYGEDGDDWIISGPGRSFANGGAGADTFVLAAMSDENGTVEFVIEEADSSDRLFVPYNFFNGSDDGISGSDLMPVLGATGTLAELAEFGEPLIFNWQLEQDRLFGTDFTEGIITFYGHIQYEFDGSDLVVGLYQADPIDVVEVIDDAGNTETFRFNSILEDTFTTLRLVDFEEGDLGLVFHDLGEPVELPDGNGGTYASLPGWDPAVQHLTNNGVMNAPVEEKPEAPTTNPNEDNGQPSEPEILNGSDGDDLIIATNTDTDISAGDGDDTVQGGDGDDTLDGGTGNDQLSGGEGDDIYVVDAAGDSVTELSGGGADLVVAYTDYTLPDNVENLTLADGAFDGTGNALDNLIMGNAADNTLAGGSGNDKLYGTLGNDTLSGGQGSDTYAYMAGDGNDLIIDPAETGAIDTLIVTGGVAPSDVTVVRLANQPNDLILQIGDGGRIELRDFYASSTASIETMRFDDQTTWSRTDLEAMASLNDPVANDPPQAVDDPFLIVRAENAVIPAASLLANDVDFDGDQLTITAIDNVSAGSAELQPSGDIALTPPPDYEGLITFTYTISDPHGGTSSAIAEVAVYPNSAPEAAADSGFSTDQDTPLVLTPDDILSNDTDADDDVLTVTQVSSAQNGTAVINSDGSVTFTPAAGYTGPASFTYTVSDNVGGSAQAQVDLTVVQTTTGQTFIGTSGADTISGTAGNDTIEGGAGDDTLIGNAGDDIFQVVGDDGLDTIDGGDGTDTLLGSVYNDTFRVASNLANLNSIEAIDGGAGTNDRILGTTGDDTIDLSGIAISGVELIDGGAGNDTITGTDAADVIRGDSGDDTLSGGLGDDIFQVVGDDGLDIIDGGDGTDTLLGSVYNDTFRVASNLANLNSIEAIDGGAGTNDRILGTTGDDTIDLSGIAISGIELIDGGAGNDTITGTDAADVIRGDSGDDTLSGGLGDDIFQVVGDDGLDIIDGGDGTDTLLGSVYNDTFRVASNLSNLNSIEAIDGGAGTNDRILGTTGDDTIDLSGITISGIELIDGGADNDTITGTDAADVIRGDSGDDTSGGLGDDIFQVVGDDGLDIIDGGDGTDTLLGSVYFERRAWRRHLPGRRR